MTLKFPFVEKNYSDYRYNTKWLVFSLVMITKKPTSGIKQWFKRGAITIIVAEGLCFFGSYFIWRKINTQRDFRKYLYDYYPTILESYYKIGETIDSENKIRQIDLTHWNKEA